MENETLVQIEILDFKFNNLIYNTLILRNKTKSYHININNPILNISLDDSNLEWENKFILIYCNGTTPKISFNVVIYKGKKNKIYCFINSMSCHFQISFYSLISFASKKSLNEYKDNHKTLIIKKDDKQFILSHNYLLFNISFLEICGLSESLIDLIEPGVSYFIDKTYLSKNSHFKFSLTNYLVDKKEILTIHLVKEDKIDNVFPDKEKESLLASLEVIFTDQNEFRDKMKITNNTLDHNIIIEIKKYYHDKTKLIKQNVMFQRYRLIPVRLLNITDIDVRIIKYEIFYYILSKISHNSQTFGNSPLQVANCLTVIQMMFQKLDQTIPGNGIDNIDLIDDLYAYYYFLKGSFQQITKYEPLKVLFNYPIINPKNFYEKALLLVKKIIDGLKEDSALTLCLTQLNFNISLDINSSNGKKNRKEFENTIIPLDILKEHLYQLLPKKIYRMYIDNSKNASYNNKTAIAYINELYLFRGKTKKELDKAFIDNDDDSCQYALPILFEIFHELFSHGKIRSAGEAGKKTPLKFSRKGKFIESSKKEAGRILESFIGNQKLIVNMKHPKVNNVTELFNEKLYTGNNFKQLHTLAKTVLYKFLNKKRSRSNSAGKVEVSKEDEKEDNEDEYEEDEYEELSEKFISCIDGESEMNSLNSSSEQDL